MRKFELAKKLKLFYLLIIIPLVILIIFLLKYDKQEPETKEAQTAKSTPQTLEEIRQITIKINNDCKSEPAICYENRTRTDLLDVYPTEQILEAIYDFDKYYSCHAFTHFIGRALYKKTASIPDAYSQVNFTCHGGAYHGVLETFLEERQTSVEGISGEELEKICRESPKKAAKNETQIFTECLHGFGHAFMFITEANLPQSLAYCDKLDAIHRERCWGGAFMENSTSSTNIDHPTQWLKEDDKFYPCTILQEHYLDQCYFYQANYLLKITNRNWRQVFSDCAQVTGQKHHDYCVLGMGAQLASVSNEQGVTTAANVCHIAKDNDAYVCIEGAVPSLFARYGGDAPQVFEFCAKVAPLLREFCFAKLGSVAKTYWQYDQNRLEATCQKAKEYTNACIGKSNNNFEY